MAVEIEAKAWVDDWEAVESALSEQYRFVREFTKSDRYFLFPGQEKPGPGLFASAFRVRTDGEKAYVTFKRKELRGDTEVNQEREFIVDDVAGFVDLAARLECREHFAKVKRGRHYEDGETTIELVHVEGLGDFLEVEIVLDQTDDDRASEMSESIRSVIVGCGIPPDRIERRPYMELLREARSAE